MPRRRLFPACRCRKVIAPSPTRISASTSPPGMPPMMGVINGTTEWIFAFEGRLSVTISNADRLMDVPRAMLAQTIWQEVSRAVGNCRPNCRRGRSCASGGRPSWRRRRKTPSVPARGRSGTISFWPATGPRPGCPRRWRARCGPAIARRRLSMAGRRGMTRGSRQISIAASRRRRGRCSIARSPTANGASSSKPTPPFRPNTCCCAIISASRSMPSWKRKIAVYLRRTQSAQHGGWPLFQDGDFDMSASVKAYFALKMIGDAIDAPHMARARRGDPRARRRGARQRLHQAHAGAVRLHSVARGAGDAGRDHAAAEMVSVPSRQDFVLEPHRHRAAAGADGAEAARAQSEECPDRRAVPRAAGDAWAGAEGAAAERGAVLVLPRRRQPAALRRADVSEVDAAARDRRARWPGSASGSTARTGSARSFRRWPTA